MYISLVTNGNRTCPEQDLGSEVEPTEDIDDFHQVLKKNFKSNEKFNIDAFPFRPFNPRWRHHTNHTFADVASWFWVCPDCKTDGVKSIISEEMSSCPRCGLPVKGHPTKYPEYRNHATWGRFGDKNRFREPNKKKMPAEYHEPDPTTQPTLPPYVAPNLGKPEERGRYWSEISYVDPDRQRAIDRLTWGLPPIPFKSREDAYRDDDER
jgi:hypothetical protein